MLCFHNIFCAIFKFYNTMLWFFYTRASQIQKNLSKRDVFDPTNFQKIRQIKVWYYRNRLDKSTKILQSKTQIALASNEKLLYHHFKIVDIAGKTSEVKKHHWKSIVDIVNCMNKIIMIQGVDIVDFLSKQK